MEITLNKEIDTHVFLELGAEYAYIKNIDPNGNYTYFIYPDIQIPADLDTLLFQTKKNDFVVQLQAKTTMYITSQYPELKQRSDLSDKEYYETLFKAYGIDEATLRLQIVLAVTSIFNGTSDFSNALTKVLNTIMPPGNIDAFEFTRGIEQLLKVAIRVTFVQRNKQVYYQILQQIENATTEAELPDLETINFVSMPAI